MRASLDRRKSAPIFAELWVLVKMSKLTVQILLIKIMKKVLIVLE